MLLSENRFPLFRKHQGRGPRFCLQRKSGRMPLAFVCSFARMDEATFPPADMRRVTCQVRPRPAWRVSRRIRSSERSHFCSSAGGVVSGAGVAGGASVAGGGVAAGSEVVEGAGAGSVDVAGAVVPSCVAAGVDVFSSLFCSEQPDTSAASAEIAKTVAVFAIGFICILLISYARGRRRNVQTDLRQAPGPTSANPELKN